jgi:hypothetical protein
MTMHDGSSGVDALLAMTRRFDHERWTQAFAGLPVDARWIERLPARREWHLAALVLLAERLQLPPPESLPAIEGPDHDMITATESQWCRWRMHSGLAWWAHAIGREVRGDVIRALQGRFGTSAVRFSARWRDTASPSCLPEDLDQLSVDVKRAGDLCTHAWLGQLPACWSAWMALHTKAGIDDEGLPPAAAALRRQWLLAAREIGDE